VLTGRRDALDRIAAALTARGVRTRPLEVTHAFHSALMEPMLARFAEVARKVGGGVPKLPVFSTVRGRALLPGEPMDADYWVEHVRGRVRFAEAATALLGEGRPTSLVELGPKPTLGPLVHRIGPRPGSHTLYLCPQEDSGGQALAAVVAELFRAGIDPVWSALYRPEERQDTLHLAPYVFSDAHRYWGRKPVTALQPDAGGPMAWEGSGWEGAGWDGASWSGGDDVGTGAGDEDAMSGSNGRRSGAQDGPDEVWEAVVAAISQVGDYTPARISAGSRLYEDLGFDSVHAMELRDRLEARLEAARELTTQELLPAMSTAGELAAFLRARGAARARVG
jgi:acyl transferase domain-containing protein